VSDILKAKILDRYSWETNPLKRVLNFPFGVCISVGFFLFYIFLAERKLHAYILLCIFCEGIFLAIDTDATECGGGEED
jgi:hypothetical protein